MTETISQLSVRFPSDDDDEPAASQDTEWCEVVADGQTHRIRFHDYHEIYDIPGLVHRLSIAVEPLEYVALVGRKRADVPDEWT